MIHFEWRCTGRYAVILLNNDGGANKHSYGHYVVAIGKLALEGNQEMFVEKIAKRANVTTFVRNI